MSEEQHGVADFLRGRWRVRRRVVDHRAGQEGAFTGWAVFADDPESGQLAYHEEGEVELGGVRRPATRSLRYAERGADVLDVTFADGREFYRLRLGEGGWSADHWCSPDTYLVAGRITGPDSYTERWRATGPAKDYELLTDYERDGGPEGP
ncbi:DUF6314 family protein [Actinosynnema mirum]|uniref:DUF6314 domain-containing protein n=1 Tax=Actinosynnema mirum (strain ATCC 29888 / DSM 43827 / JCM 3225 / NBRC 14064 / NCIMB 13271 / NRRL B-12336 / IMRU 3971 / 101) TaxID=446462 RepID=C6WC10_ACTMD|nr:DUF6314 family protein [Actinosynnema mirum]ACU37577.1 conserved hypothetical protein [Actinosynnema mirum DSM 43827]